MHISGNIYWNFFGNFFLMNIFYFCRILKEKFMMLMTKCYIALTWWRKCHTCVQGAWKMSRSGNILSRLGVTFSTHSIRTCWDPGVSGTTHRRIWICRMYHFTKGTRTLTIDWRLSISCKLHEIRLVPPKIYTKQEKINFAYAYELLLFVLTLHCCSSFHFLSLILKNY